MIETTWTYDRQCVYSGNQVEKSMGIYYGYLFDRRMKTMKAIRDIDLIGQMHPKDSTCGRTQILLNIGNFKNHKLDIGRFFKVPYFLTF